MCHSERIKTIRRHSEMATHSSILFKARDNNHSGTPTRPFRYVSSDEVIVVVLVNSVLLILDRIGRELQGFDPASAGCG